ncbi:two component response regulator [Streptomyces viridosporus ATCC 14672]|uniref:Two component response regulator n=1 Tax=Streptomyces viridosporus (strain ATCC 14672 / DSM 40746 / JCM 4963 / KCTC 9882 / NRRL B-12104 / FH 1290) TaxID=566461 RepID=D5ZX18_STRV1|nr:two component response regulator [Streptomyces viridosporus ATCC 14672]
MARAITVAVVDDDRMLLDGLRVRLDGVPEVLLAARARTVDGLPARPARTGRPPDPCRTTSSCWTRCSATGRGPRTTSGGCAPPARACS